MNGIFSLKKNLIEDNSRAGPIRIHRSLVSSGPTDCASSGLPQHPRLCRSKQCYLAPSLASVKEARSTRRSNKEILTIGITTNVTRECSGIHTYMIAYV